MAGDGPSLTPDSLRAALDACASESAMRETIRAAARRLRKGEAKDPQGCAVVLWSLATHPSAPVRQEVAEAADTFHPPFFELARAHFPKDPDRFVRAAFERAAKAYAANAKAEAKAQTAEQELAAMFDEIERLDGGKGARRRAERAARRAVALEGSRVRHELSPAKASFIRAIAGLRGASAAEVKKQAGHLWGILDRFGTYAAEVKAVFAEERLLDVVEEACGRVEQGDAEVAVVVDVPPSLSLECDRIALCQALQNAIKNAVESYEARARTEPGEVRVWARTEEDDTKVAIAVADRGAGMTPEEVKATFAGFASKKKDGTGVGMPMAKKMIEDVHGGDFTVESAPGEGTTIRMTIPRRQVDGR